MKVKALTSLFIALAFLSIQSCTSEAKADTQVAEEKTEVLAEAKAEKVDMKVEGMVCAMGCAKFIETEVADMDGILNSKVDFESGIASFEFDQNKLDATEIETFINEIHDGQYKAKIVAANEKEVTPKEDSNSEDISTEEEETDVVAVVKESVNISLPKLFTYFLKSLR